MERTCDETFWNTSEIKGFDFSDSLSDASLSTDPVSCADAKMPDTLMQYHRPGVQESMDQVIPLSQVSLISGNGTKAFTSFLSLHGNNLRHHLGNKPHDGRTTPQETVTNMVFGYDYCLEQHKGLDDKLDLLDAAIKSHDGNAITAVVLFLQKSLKTSVFHHHLLKRSEAVNHYLQYLEIDNEYDELSHMLQMLGRAEDAAILKYTRTIREKRPEDKMKKLENCLNTHFQIKFVPPLFAQSVSEHISILQRQLPIEEDDVRQEKEGSNELFCKFPRKHTLVDVSVITTLFYCCLYHYNLPENHLASPSAIRKQHQLTEKQFVWAALSALAQQRSWVEINNLFLTKSWLGNTQLKCCIGFNRAVSILGNANAPDEVLLKYIKLVPDFEEKINLAKKYKFHKYILDTLLHARDRCGLILYKSELSPGSEEVMEVDQALLTQNVKWKN